ncbi:MAG TPA: response regulator [Pseudolabrys sp.]|nr:response regulator [Pseudolabrys sp.]
MARGRRHPPRILIIEDEFLIALLIEEISRDIGYRISGIAHNTAEARAALAKRNFDAVLLDINLDGRSDPEIADLLVKRGIPFGFVTGYEYVIEPRHETVPILEKPFTSGELRAFLEKLTGPAMVGASAP